VGPVIAILGGCATLPNVSATIHNAPTTQQSVQILSARGLLSPAQSQALLDRLQRSVDPTEMLERHTALMEAVSDSPLTKGNKVTLLVNGPATYAAMFRMVESARDHINIESFTVEDVADVTGRKLADVLLQKQAAGVQVNLIYDSLGSLDTPAAFFQRLRDGGIRVLEFNPQNPLKARGKWRPIKSDHRKILIVDGRIALAGGVNLSRVYTSRPSRARPRPGAAAAWRDTDVQIEGPAVAEFQKLFLDTWRRQQGPKLADRHYFPALRETGTSLVRVLGSAAGKAGRPTFIMYVAAMMFAERSLHITTAYFVPDSQTMNALTAAARRGVDVKIILPKNTDSGLALRAGQYHYAELLRAGVKLYRRRDVMLHAKTLVIDGVWSTVGSSNLDWLSFSNNDEVNAVVLSREFAGEMERLFAKDLARSEEIRWPDWKRRPFCSRLGELWAHLFAHFL
jgi:cardiolipin synthase A/B